MGMGELENSLEISSAFCLVIFVPKVILIFIRSNGIIQEYNYNIWFIIIDIFTEISDDF